MSYKVVVVVVALEDEVIVLEVTVLEEEDNIMEVVAVDETALEVMEEEDRSPDPEACPGEDGQDGDGTSVGPLPFEGWKGAQ
jgi:hypothetical protein